MVGVDAERRLKGGDGLVRVAQLVQGDAEVGRGVGVAGAEAQGFAVSPEGLIQASQGAEGDAEVVAIGGAGGGQGDGLGDEGDGSLVVAPMVLDDPEQVQGPWVQGLGREDLAVEGLGAVQVAGFVPGDGLGEGIGRHPGWHGLAREADQGGRVGDAAERFGRDSVLAAVRPQVPVMSLPNLPPDRGPGATPPNEEAISNPHLPGTVRSGMVVPASASGFGAGLGSPKHAKIARAGGR